MEKGLVWHFSMWACKMDKICHFLWPISISHLNVAWKMHISWRVIIEEEFCFSGLVMDQIWHPKNLPNWPKAVDAMVTRTCVGMDVITWVHDNHISNLVTLGDHWLTGSNGETIPWIAFCKKGLQMGPEWNILCTSMPDLSIPKMTLHCFNRCGEGLCVAQEQSTTDPHWLRFTIWWFLGWFLLKSGKSQKFQGKKKDTSCQPKSDCNAFSCSCGDRDNIQGVFPSTSSTRWQWCPWGVGKNFQASNC